MDQYRAYLGPDVFSLVQIEVAAKADAAKLEREFVQSLNAAEARRGREWFKMPYPRLACLLSDVLTTTTAEVLKIRGAPCQVDGYVGHLVNEVKRIRHLTFTKRIDSPFY